MTPRDIRKYLFDIKEACERLTRFASGKGLEDYLADEMLRSAVERQFEIIGEALGQAVRVDEALIDQISDARRIIAFRHRLIHGYSSVSDEVVWGVVESSLPRLMMEVTAMLPGDNA
jgi:uncharacterized protein with HEPN domain